MKYITYPLLVLTVIFLSNCGKKDEPIPENSEVVETAAEDSTSKNNIETITIISFQDAQDANYGYNIAQMVWDTLQTVENLQFVLGDELIKKLTQDPEYQTKDTPSLLRKWGNELNIRYIITGTITSISKDSSRVHILISDSQFEYPIVKTLNGKRNDLPSMITFTIKDMMENIQTVRKDLAIQMIQAEWMKKRQTLMNKPAPKFNLKSLDGKDINLDNLKGKFALFHFFSMDCEYCKEELEWMKDFQKRENVQVIGINMDTGLEDSVKSYIKDYDVQYPVVVIGTDDNDYLENYYTNVTPQTTLIDKNGIVRETLIGFNESMKKKLESLIDELDTDI